MDKIIGSLKYIIAFCLIVADSLLFAGFTTFDITLNNDSEQKILVTTVEAYSTSSPKVPAPAITLEEIIVDKRVEITQKSSVEIPHGKSTEFFAKIEDVNFSGLTEFTKDLFTVQRIEIIEDQKLVGVILFQCSLLNTHPTIVIESPNSNYSLESCAMPFGGGGMHFVIKKK